jgi:hypothetical protein
MVVPVKLEESVRTRHDQWTKDALSLWLKGLGDVRLDARIAGASRRGDVLFTEVKAKGRSRKTLGLLGELARGCVLFEPFRNPVTSWEIETCLVKTIEHTAQKIRLARRSKQKQSTVEHTALCVITPSASVSIKNDAELTLFNSDEPGFYRMAKLLRTVVVVVDELPKTASTMWLRLLGRGEVQAQAVAELLEMSEHEPIRDATFDLLVTWRQNLPKSVRADIAECLMNWEPIYERWEKKTLKKGRAEGKAEGKAEAIVTVLQSRGLSPTATQRKQILQCKDIQKLDAWLRKASTTSDVDDLFAPPAQPRRRTRRAA